MSKTMHEIIAEMEADRQKYAAEAASERTVLAAAMVAAGVTCVTIGFNGYGDSGQIVDVTIQMREGVTAPSDLEKRVTDWAYSFLAGTGIDWYNNDGGFGEIQFDCTTVPVHFTCSISQNETVSTEVYTEDTGA